MKNLHLLIQQIKGFLQNWNNSRIRLKFEARCLKEDKTTFNPNNAVNFFDRKKT